MFRTLADIFLTRADLPAPAEELPARLAPFVWSPAVDARRVRTDAALVTSWS